MTDPPLKLAAFHIGAHKTGTSVVQDALPRNPSVLRRLDMLFLTRSEMSDYVGWGDVLEHHPERLGARLAEWQRDTRYRYLFGSHENTLGRPFARGADRGLYPRAEHYASLLKAAVRGCRTRIFLTVRPQHEFLESYYLQTVHQGSADEFAKWLAMIDLDALSWHRAIRPLEVLFGADNVEVVDFNTIRNGQAQYVESMLQRLTGVAKPGIRYGRSRNRSISDKGLRIALAVNPLLRSKREQRLMRKFLQRHFSNVHYPRPTLLSREERGYLAARYATEYEELFSKPSSATQRPYCA